MKVRATRGVCIGVEKHLKEGDVVDLDTAMVQYLTSIKAVEPYVEPATESAPVVPAQVAGGFSGEGEPHELKKKGEEDHAE